MNSAIEKSCDFEPRGGGPFVLYRVEGKEGQHFSILRQRGEIVCKVTGMVRIALGMAGWQVRKFASWRFAGWLLSESNGSTIYVPLGARQP